MRVAERLRMIKLVRAASRDIKHGWSQCSIKEKSSDVVEAAVEVLRRRFPSLYITFNDIGEEFFNEDIWDLDCDIGPFVITWRNYK